MSTAFDLVCPVEVAAGETALERRDREARQFRTLASPTRPPVERYMRCSVDVHDEGGRVMGSVEAGLSYEVPDDLRLRRSLYKTIEGIVADYAAVTDESSHDITRRLESALIHLWPDRAWFVEIWNAHEALTQVYQPFGMPRHQIAPPSADG